MTQTHVNSDPTEKKYLLNYNLPFLLHLLVLYAFAPGYAGSRSSSFIDGEVEGQRR